ncbi:pyrimidine 5'-nucleotidase [Vibrio kanaloae]|nr:pyrimidine 5'-nucleotidase [Vibrio kanaloae]TKF17043.1 pyrimidine 5'-nucleotidase [Vibrio kanaloae]
MADIGSVLPGAKELMEAITGKAKVGIITNGFTDLQAIRLARTGMDSYIDQVIISEEVGMAKPDSIIFEHALQRAGNPCKSKVLMVGDNLHSDILGSINFGIETFWLNPHGAMAADGINQHYTVSSLTELQAILEA